MAKRRKISVSPNIVKFLVVVLLSFTIGIFLCKRVFAFFTNSDYFSIKSVMVDSSLSVIDDQELANLKGRNIFLVDLSKVHQHLAFKYPQVSDLRIIRQFPNRIQVQAKPRYPFAQLQAGGKVLTLDESGIVLSSSSSKNEKLPLIVVSDGNYDGYVLGASLKRRDHAVALDIIQSFRVNRALSSYDIEQIDIESLSKVNVYLSNELYVIFDGSKVDQKAKILGLILAQGKVDPKEVKYVDLRFNEPIVGKK